MVRVGEEDARYQVLRQNASPFMPSCDAASIMIATVSTNRRRSVSRLCFYVGRREGEAWRPAVVEARAARIRILTGVYKQAAWSGWV